MMIRSEGCKPAGQLVELRVVRRQAGDFLAARVQLFQRAERSFDDGRDVHESLSNAVLRELEDGLLGASQHLLGFVGMLDGLGDGVLRQVDEAAQQRLVAHDAHVVLDRGPVGHAIDQRRQIRNPADGFHFFAAVEFLDQRDHVHRTAALLQIAHARINTAMRVQRKVVRREIFSGLIVERVVEQDRAQD